MEQITVFLGWSTLINIGLLMFSLVFLTAFRAPILRLHGALFGVSSDELMPRYVGFIAQYKLLIIFFYLVPWIVLKAAF